MRRSLPLLAILLAVGCAHPQANQSAPPTAPALSSPTAQRSPAASSSPTTSSSPTSSPAPTAAAPAPTGAAPEVPLPCADDAVRVTAGAVEEADTSRRVVVSFTNSSAQVCTLVGYPGADLVTAAGGVLVHVARRPANSAPHLELHPGEVATADVASSAVDTTTGAACGRIGTLVVTAPGRTAAHTLEANLPICDATISAVG